MRPALLTIAAALLAFSPLAAQTGAAHWTVPRTADGHPDLEGIWSNTSSVPLERPRELGAKEFYTKEEAAEIERRGFQGDRNPLPQAHYDLSQFGLDPTQSKYAENLRTSMIIGPEGRIPPQTPEARQRNAARAAWNKIHGFDGPETRPLGEQCIVWPKEGPPMLPSAYNNNLQIVQAAGYVAILQEMIHDVRMIPTDGRPHAPSNIREYLGDSRGHWEGDTLVVDTTNFTDRTNFRGSTASLHVVERFTRTDADTILYEFTVEDPATWAKSWTGQLPMTRIKGPLYEYACHEGNYGMANNLSAARAEEKKAEAGVQ